MKSFIAASALIALASANATPTGPFTIGAWNPTTAWYGTGINANGGGFYIGKSPSSYCPTGITGLNCTLYPGASTVLVTGGTAPNMTVSLDVAVPGGQQVFVAPNGALSYTPPHSTFAPTGSIFDGFDRFISNAGGGPTPLYFESNNFGACPVTGESGVYQVFARAVASSETLGNCTVFEMRTYTADGVVAWEY
ncbi:hypothetical protein G7Y89_g6668 [Cudoniella acicularis]|uniref:Uncharacterized protein n=1 Tax=Cudoniella acicularis TaxID=354080 RepID=A0A8H4RLI6_9HELO|nr:hypothetical protein G7Y89_g6668 [Cudoniella acicularis]